MNADRAPAQVLVVCTANICRSPFAARSLDRELTASGLSVDVTSAGTHGGFGEVHADTVAAGARVGIDMSAHRSRRLTHRLLTPDAVDLVVTMARDHLFAVIAIDESAWPRTFTLVDLVRRAEALAAEQATTADFSEWIAVLAEGRRTTDRIFGSRRDDIADPYGRPRRHHLRMVREVDDLCRRLAVAAAAVLPAGVRGQGG